MYLLYYCRGEDIRLEHVYITYKKQTNTHIELNCKYMHQSVIVGGCQQDSTAGNISETNVRQEINLGQH